MSDAITVLKRPTWKWIPKTVDNQNSRPILCVFAAVDILVPFDDVDLISSSCEL